MKPNIIILNPDQMRADAVSHLGKVKGTTPFLDEFAAEEAVSFRYAFCQNTVCVPSRCSFLTGFIRMCTATGQCVIYCMSRIRPCFPN